MAEPEKKKKRKRGGLAGMWDKHKSWIKPVASGIAGALTGGLGATAVGAAMGGFDRPGKGPGFDLGGAVKGGLAGYGAGAIGAGLKGGVQGAMQAGGNNLEQFFTGAQGGMGQYTQPVLGTKTTVPGAAGTPDVTQRLGGMFGVDTNMGKAVRGAAEFGRKNESWLGPAATAMASFSGGSQAANVREQELALEREKFKRTTSQQDALAQLLNPMFQAQAQRVGTGYRG